MKNDKLKKEILLDDDIEKTIQEQMPDNSELLERIQEEQEINAELELKLEREEIVDEEIKTDEDIERHRHELERFFAKKDLEGAKEEKARLSKEINELIARREELQIAIRRKLLTKVQREDRILKDSKDRENLER